MPALVIHGDRAETVNPQNADQTVAHFDVMNQQLCKEANGRGEGLQVHTSTGRSTGGYQYETAKYVRAERLLIQKVIIFGQGHAWSGDSADYPYNDPDVPNASEIVCNFFSEHGFSDAFMRLGLATTA
jgi:poly(3-hydroxybutyrate) depolymerase